MPTTWPPPHPPRPTYWVLPIQKISGSLGSLCICFKWTEVILDIFTVVNMTNIILTTWSSAVCIQRIKRPFINTSYQDQNSCMRSGAVCALRCDFPTNSVTETVFRYANIMSQKCENCSVLQVPTLGCCISRKCVQRECGGPESGNWAFRCTSSTT